MKTNEGLEERNLTHEYGHRSSDSHIHLGLLLLLPPLNYRILQVKREDVFVARPDRDAHLALERIQPVARCYFTQRQERLTRLNTLRREFRKRVR